MVMNETLIMKIAIYLATMSLMLHLPTAKAGQATTLRILDDCLSDQFYDYSRSSCRNCSDIVQLFQTNQDWIHREVVSSDSSQLQPNQRSKASLSGGFVRLSANGRLQAPNRGRPSSSDAADGDMLSRLITVDSQDPEFVELMSEDHDVEDQNSRLHSSEDLDQGADSDLSHSLKQSQLTVDRFIMSSFVEDELPGAIDDCRQNQNSSACQMWANMCVMTMYSYSDTLTPHPKATMSNNQVLKDGKGKRPSGRRWQDCKQFDVYSICNSLRDWYRSEKKSNSDVKAIYAVEELLSKPNSSPSFRTNQPIHLLAYKYSYDGKLLKVDQFGLNEMEKFCHMLSNSELTQPDSEASLIRVGKNMQLKCQSNGNQASYAAVKNFNETIFVDLYIGHPVNGAMLVKPIPVLVRNLVHNGVEINRRFARDPSRWKLVHRFFYQSALNFANNDDENPKSTSSTANDDKTIIYVKSASIEFRYKLEEKSTHMSSALLTLDYGQFQQRRLSTIEGTFNGSRIERKSSPWLVRSEITITHSLIDMNSYKRDLDLIMTILCILSSIWSLIKCYTIQKCHGIIKLDLELLFKFTVIACDMVANLLVIITFAFMSYLFFMFRFQTGLQILAPTEDLESALALNIYLALALKSVGLSQRLYTNLNVDVFFVDWEKPKMLTSAQMLNHWSTQNTNQGNSQNAAASVDLKAEPKLLSIPSQQSSFWRPYTVIKKWLNLQISRRQNLAFQLFMTVGLFEATQISNLAQVDPVFSFLANSELRIESELAHLRPTISVAFRAYVLSIAYVSLYFLQFIFKRYIYEIFIRHEISEFIDLCSVANVGVFCMVYPRFGYYIHGRNANGSGDCSISEINALLEREEQDLCSKRGLAPNSDEQVFTVILPKIINDHYQKLLYHDDLYSLPMDKHSNFGRFNQSESKPIGQGILRSAMNLPMSSALSSTGHAKSSSFMLNHNSVEMMVMKNKSINNFLINFLEHNYKNIDYSIKDMRKLQSMLLFDVDSDEENLLNRNLSFMSMAASDQDKTSSMTSSTAATFYRDNSNRFTSLFLQGSEIHLVIVELLTLLILDAWLGHTLVIAVQIVWLFNHLFESVYLSCARRNLVSKAMVDEKFLTA